jgi:hypothetical protein
MPVAMASSSNSKENPIVRRVLTFMVVDFMGEEGE